MTSGLQDRPSTGGGVPGQLVDLDPGETGEWVASLDGAVDQGGRARARFLMLRLLQRARERQVGVPGLHGTDYLNTILPEFVPADVSNINTRVLNCPQCADAVRAHHPAEQGLAPR